ncbi:hypothetical protein [Rubritalea tangerina]|uniref:hypothetical protein n=1 Tax=Rubritalea tangerina TaxID=430798 RepID=UPI0036086F13
MIDIPKRFFTTINHRVFTRVVGYHSFIYSLACSNRGNLTQRHPLHLFPIEELF